MDAVSREAQISAKDAWYSGRSKDWFILEQLVTKDFKLKYRRSVLGVAWSVLNPLFMMLVLAAVFSSFMRYQDPSMGNYAVYLILGNTAFQLMSDSTTQGMSSIIAAAPLLKKVKINRYIFPVQKVLFAGVNYAFSIVAIALVMLVERVPLGPTALLWPFALLMLILFSIGLALLLSALSVFFRDVMHLWSVVITAWTYLTPLFYPVSVLPEWLRGLEMFNPMYVYVTYIREVVLYQQVPSLKMHIACVACALVSLLVGYLSFHRHEHKFILYI
ncbi:ABC transporter permease [Olsenella urininfantis]|uniref:ABC transporter permease n=1 Tax=Olsenella urininfantis TaxID=1871033 RepID=UPI00190EDEC5|nr:ABC transporter permease [Olsenella urininfantis]